MIFVSKDIIVIDAPSPPRNLEFEEINKDFVILKWDEPEHDGGSEITQYLVEKSEVIRFR